MRVLARELIGRRAELKTLDDALGEAARGRLQLALVSGPAGMGKSALIRSFSGIAERHGARVILAECVREGSLRPFDPFLTPDSAFVDALRDTVDDRRSFLDPPERHRAFHAIAERIRLTSTTTTARVVRDPDNPYWMGR